MHQLDLGLSDPTMPAEGRYHLSDEPSTSRRAAALVAPKTGSQRERVLVALLMAGDRGMTDDELAEATGLDRYIAGTRRGELEKDSRFGGWVLNSGRERRSRKGNAATVWILAPAAREQLTLA